MGNGYSLIDTFDHSNYLTKFNFYSGPDPGNWGFLNYVSAAEALNTGLVSTIQTSQGTDFRVGVDYKNNAPLGRNSVRIESAQKYQYGLFVTYFTHFPKPTCGSWPAFWMYSYDNLGEFDIFENWNMATNNRITFHTSSQYPTCALDSEPLDSADPIVSTQCYSPENIGCGIDENDGFWAQPTGGTYALEWTAWHVKVWSFAPGTEPADLLSKSPVPADWPTPNIQLTTDTCSDLNDAFGPMNIILNIAFCGNPVSIDAIWGQTCAASTGTTCNDYVANNPSAFKDVYFQVNRMEIYQLS